MMVRELTLTSDPINEAELLASRRVSPATGAVVCFAGVVRGAEDGEAIEGIEYEAFVAMAEHQFGLLFDEVEQRWPIQSVRLVHRTGFVRKGEPSLWVEVLSSHRAEAFEACQHLIDRMKQVAPIWKKPHR